MTVPERPSDDDINRVLAEINPTLRTQHRALLGAGEPIAVPSDSATLLYVIEGELSASASARSASLGSFPAELSQGDAALFRGDLSGTLIAQQESFVLVTSLDFSSLSAGARDRLPEVLLVRDLPGNEPAVAALAAQLGPEISSARGDVNTAAHSVHCQMMANTVLLSVIHTWAVRGCAPAGWPSRTNDPFLDRVLAAIDADPGSDWKVEELARAGAMSRSAFSERFRSAIGTSPGKYVGAARIRSAQTLLAKGMGVSEVSRATGYSSDEGFSRAFQRSLGVPPSVWRSEALQNATT